MKLPKEQMTRLVNAVYPTDEENAKMFHWELHDDGRLDYTE
jgi:hypothetical protein